MKKLAKLFICLFVLLAAPAFAQIAMHSSPYIQKMVSYHQRIATAFGCDTLANQDFDSALAILEFLPRNQSFPDWSRMFTANILPLPEQENQVASRMVAFRQNLLDTIGKSGKVVDVRDLKTAKGLPVTYIEYVAGQGADVEHAAGVFARHTTQLAAFTQVQIRGGQDLSETDRSNMEQLAINMSRK